MTLEVVVLGGPLSLIRVVDLPEVERGNVEVLAVDAYLVLVDEPADQLGHHRAAIFVGEVEQARCARPPPSTPVRRDRRCWPVQYPFRVFGLQPGAREYAFWFEPHEQPGAVPSGVDADWSETAWKALLVSRPRAGDAPI